MLTTTLRPLFLFEAQNKVRYHPQAVQLFLGLGPMDWGILAFRVGLELSTTRQLYSGSIFI